MSEWATEPFDMTSDYDPDIPEVPAVKYNTLSDHDDVFEVPEMMVDDTPVYIGITHLGVESDRDVGGYRSRFAYSVATGPYDADVQYQGEDLRGPAIGGVTENEIAVSLMGFISAYGEGPLLDEDGSGEGKRLYHDGDIVAMGETAEFIHANAERFGIAGSDLEEGYIAYTETYLNETLGQYVRRAVPTGKEME